MRRLAILTVGTLLAFGLGVAVSPDSPGSLAASASSPTTVVVSPVDMHGWAFGAETGTTGSGQMVIGPGTPPLGRGSARLTVASATDGFVLIRPGWNGIPLADITKLEYSTYRASGASPLAISLQLQVDDDITDLDNSWKGRLVFEPYYTNTVQTGQWQTWDTLTSSGSGNWWGTKAPFSTACPISNPCTWSEVLSHFPNAGIHQVSGAVLFKAGSGWTAFDGNVDALTIGIDGDETTYNFEPLPNIRIDIKPGSDPNSINPKSKGIIPVAILSDPAFEPVDDVDRDTLTFGATGDEHSFTGRCDDAVGDLNSDGTPDMVCYFYTQHAGFGTGSTSGTLKGQTVGGTPIEGTDSVRIVPSP